MLYCKKKKRKNKREWYFDSGKQVLHAGCSFFYAVGVWIRSGEPESGAEYRTSVHGGQGVQL